MKFEAVGIRVYVSFPAIAVISISYFMSKGGNRLLLMCLISSALHECSHLYFICRYKGKPESISIKPGEVSINCNLCDITYRQDMIITISGVAGNFIFSIFCFLFGLCSSVGIFYDLAVCNLIIGGFNLLPVRSFDGGQIIELLLSRKLSIRASEIIINIVTCITVVPLVTVGAYILLISNYNYSMLLLAIYCLLLIINKEMR